MNQQQKLTFFSLDELTDWNGVNYAAVIDPRVLWCADHLRALHGLPIYVSTHPEAIARFTSESSYSDHHVSPKKRVSWAIDVFPQWANGNAPGSRGEIEAFKESALTCGFTAVGLYGDTEFRGNPWVMAHLAVGSSLEKPKMWGRIESDYVSIEMVISAFPRTASRSDHPEMV